MSESNVREQYSSEPSLQADPDVRLPKRVIAEAARADALFNQFRDSPATPEQGGPQPEEQPQGQPENQQPVVLQEPQQQFTPPGNQPGNQPGNEPPPDDDSWQFKYKSTHGRLLKQEANNREMADQIRNLQNVIATMQATSAAAPAPAQQQGPEFSFQNLITEDERRDYGEDFLEVVGKRAQESLAPVFANYQSKIDALTQRLEGVNGFVQVSAQEKLLSTLDRSKPEWRTINTNPAFLDWLRLPDPFSGAIRHDMLKAAYAQGNAPRVLAFFNGFLAQEAAVAPANTQPGNAGRTLPKTPLENFAAPGRAKAAASTGGPAEKPFFTRAQIAAFYSDVAAGKYRGRDAEKDRNESAIFAAQQEGRITG